MKIKALPLAVEPYIMLQKFCEKEEFFITHVELIAKHFIIARSCKIIYCNGSKFGFVL